MPKLTAPLISADATGRLGAALIFSKWKGRRTVRKLTKPSPPPTGKQIGLRAFTRWLCREWCTLTAAQKATWQTLASSSNIAPYNAFTAENIKRWRSDLAPGKTYPVGETGFWGNIQNIVASDGIGCIHLDFDCVSVNDSWSCALFSATPDAYLPVWYRTIDFINVDAIAHYHWVYRPLPPGFHWIVLYNFSDDGNFRAAPINRAAWST